jgi:hypothetical protein
MVGGRTAVGDGLGVGAAVAGIAAWGTRRRGGATEAAETAGTTGVEAGSPADEADASGWGVNPH